ncbi:universal stress protein [Georgenia sp. SYP-B2076]|uniref:universal stress protein n=1 Tax=Georgenia sp. SYP-B2076 TaxID=2495881 RepID=UPI000F8C52AB|nr:universal stress protein [Georgenia sp. SYP-B2076]
MTSPTFPDGAVVVGVDGTGKAERALVWAGNEAARRKAAVHIVYAFPWLTSVRSDVVMPAADVVEAGERITTAAMNQVRAAHPEVTVTTEVLLEEPDVALVNASERASFVVMGARGLGRIASRLRGSVSQKVASHAHSPVVVVREEAKKIDGPVVVGVDLEDNATNVLEFAFATAASRGFGVLVVHADRGDNVRPEFVDEGVQRFLSKRSEATARAVEELVSGVRERYPEVPVEIKRVAGHPVDALVSESEQACMVVVGSRGRRGLAGLGSVSRGVLHEAPVVAVVREPAAT